MATDYAQQGNGLDGFAEDLLVDLDPVGDGAGFIASGSDVLNPRPSLPPNLDPYRPFEYNLDLLTPIPDAGSLFTACALPNTLGFDQLPSFPQAFGLPANFPPANIDPPPNLDFIPSSDFAALTYGSAAPPLGLLQQQQQQQQQQSPPPLLPPPPLLATGIGDYYCAALTGLDHDNSNSNNNNNDDNNNNNSNAPQMPANSAGSQFNGGVFSNFSGGSSASPSGCPFAPPRFNQQQHHTQNPTPPQSNSLHFNSVSYTSIFHPLNPRFAIQSRTTPQTSDDINSAPPAPGCTTTRDPNSDDYLAALIRGGVSSPSLPPLSSSPLRLDTSTSQQHSRTQEPLSPPQPDHNMPRRDSLSVNRTAASTRSRRHSSVSVTSMVDLTSPKLERDGESPSAVDSAAPMAPPPTRKRPRAPATSTTRASPRHPSTSAKTRPVKPLPSKRKGSERYDDALDDSSSLFGKEEEDEDVLDLTGSNEVPAELLKPKVDNRVKLSKFQCSICMDDVSGLTVTHCGHMFCSECLHSALHIDHMKKTCPICRQKVDLKAKFGQKQGKNTFYHLELKLMTANRKGKRPVGQ